MGDRVLEIVMHLMDHLRDNHGQLSDMDGVFSDLKGLGYTDNEISSAYSWVMDRFDSSDTSFFSQFPEKHYSSRILTNYERHLLTPEAHGFLINLLHHNLIDDEQFESILERSTMFSPKPVTLDQMRLVASAVVFRDFSEFDESGWIDTEGDPSQVIN